MNGNQQVLDRPEENNNFLPEQSDAYTVAEEQENAFAKVAIATLIGATIGAIAGILSLKDSAPKINQSVKKVGNAVKNVLEGTSQTVQNAGNTVKASVETINETVKEVGNSIKNSAVNANDTINETINSVKTTAVNVNDTVKNTMHIVKGAAEGVNENVQNTVDIAKKAAGVDEANTSTNEPENPVTYVLVPLENQK